MGLRKCHWGSVPIIFRKDLTLFCADATRRELRFPQVGLRTHSRKRAGDIRSDYDVCYDADLCCLTALLMLILSRPTRTGLGK